MVRTMLLVLSMLMGVVFSTSPLASAQEDVDIQAVSETVLGAEAEALLTGLETPIADADLPAGFSAAEFVDPDQATGEEGVIPAEDLDGTLGSVAYMIGYEPSATDDAVASPESGAAPLSFGFSSLNYVVFEDELGPEELEEFKAGVEEGIAGESAATPAAGEASENATVEDITVGDTDAVLLTYIIEEEGVQSVVQMVAVPVGNVMVMSMVVLAAESVDADALRADAESLALSGVDYLGTVAESA